MTIDEQTRSVAEWIVSTYERSVVNEEVRHPSPMDSVDGVLNFARACANATSDPGVDVEDVVQDLATSMLQQSLHGNSFRSSFRMLMARHRKIFIRSEEFFDAESLDLDPGLLYDIQTIVGVDDFAFLMANTIEGRTVTEISHSSGVPRHTIGRRIKHAIAKIRCRLLWEEDNGL